MTEDGYLVLEGRKKDLYKTSYGKYVQPSKVEALLRNFPPHRREHGGQRPAILRGLALAGRSQPSANA